MKRFVIGLGSPEAIEAQGDDDWPALDEGLPHPFDLWTQANVGESLPEPMSPLTWSAIPHFVNSGFRYLLRSFKAPYLDEIRWVGRFYGRIYGNEGAVAYVLSREFGLPGSFLDAAFGGRRNLPPQQGERVRPLRLVRQLPAILRGLASQRDARQELADLFEDVDRQATAFLQQSLEPLSDQELWLESNRWLEHGTNLLSRGAEAASQSFFAFAVLERLMDHWCGRKELAHDLVTGLAGLYSAEMGPALWTMAQEAKDLGLSSLLADNSPKEALIQVRETSAAQPLQVALDHFLQRHGHRCPNEFEWRHPRWVEAPEQVLEAVAGYLQAGLEKSPGQVETRQRQKRRDAMAWLDTHLDPFRRAILHRILAAVQNIVRARDNYRHYYTKVLFALRRIYLTLGHRWVARGWLAQVDDIFFLTIPDVETVVKAHTPAAVGLELAGLTTARRQAYDHWFSIQAPEIIDADGQALETEQSEVPSGVVLQGIGASAGQAEGTARIIHDPSEARRLQAGDILVTRATDPGWTPVFPILGGLILEVGGQLSHGAIVAREYGLPAVLNVQDATRRIRDGQRVSIDGAAGRICLERT